MIYQACGLDKKILVLWNEDFLCKGYKKDVFAVGVTGFEPNKE